MARIENAEQQFHQILNDHINKGVVAENLEIDFSENTDFYELCKRFADVGLNAPNWKSEDGLQIEASFQFEDMDNAVNGTIDFIQKYKIANTDALFEIIRVMHPHAVEWEDKHSRSATTWKNDNNRYAPRVGNYTVFSQLPEDVFNQIKEAVIKGMKKWQSCHLYKQSPAVFAGQLLPGKLSR